MSFTQLEFWIKSRAQAQDRSCPDRACLADIPLAIFLGLTRHHYDWVFADHYGGLALPLAQIPFREYSAS